jgi:acetyltransferase-like isoleucine patch superfamily enzyme
MKTLTKTWNGMPLGIPFALISLFLIIYERLMDKVITILVKPGLGKCGKNVTIQKGVTIRYPKNIQIENNVRIGRNVTLVSESDYGTLIIKKKKCSN